MGIPSIANTFYQRIFYPDLYCTSVEEAQKLLSKQYDWFGPFVKEAQATLQYLSSTEAKEEFVEYLLRDDYERLPRRPLRHPRFGSNR